MRYLLFFMMIISLISCNQSPTGIEKLPELTSTDSVEILYFDEPDNDRYFTYLPTTNKEFIGSLVEDLSEHSIEEFECFKKGKIYMFSKGKIFTTVYFSHEQCDVLRFIHNGKVYYFKPSDETKKLLSDMKPKAKALSK
ncbi:MAG: hypothetical protein ACXWV4_02555 [Flavitalea sp.]